MSNGKRVKLSCFESLLGYGGRVDIFAGGGGIVDCKRQYCPSPICSGELCRSRCHFEQRYKPVDPTECLGRTRQENYLYSPLTAGFGEVKAKTRAVATASA